MGTLPLPPSGEASQTPSPPHIPHQGMGKGGGREGTPFPPLFPTQAWVACPLRAHGRDGGVGQRHRRRGPRPRHGRPGGRYPAAPTVRRRPRTSSQGRSIIFFLWPRKVAGGFESTAIQVGSRLIPEVQRLESKTASALSRVLLSSGTARGLERQPSFLWSLGCLRESPFREKRD